MITKHKELSYFSLRLHELLNTSFPELSGDTIYISNRAQLAVDAYEEAFTSGNSIEICTEIAEYILFEGLHFSVFDTVFSVVCNEFDTIMADEALRPFAIKMMSACETIFFGYNLSDDFGDSPEFDLLYTELVGIIQIWIEENGLQ
nr:DUF1896 domain-containing protein [uncultured Flavobacterium sp.]